MGGKKKKGRYSGKIKIVDSRLLRSLLMIPIGILFLVLKGRILGRILLSGALLFFSYFWKKENPLLAKAILIITACMPWFTVLGMSQRQLVLAEIVLLYGSVVALLYWNIKCRCSNAPVLAVAGFFLILIFDVSGLYIYVEDGTDMLYWPVYLACAAAMALVFAFLTYYDIFYLKDDRISEKVAVCLLAAALGFALPWTTVNNLNYVLDKSEPAVYGLVINEKDIYTSSKGATSYYLVVDCNGEELKMEVSQSKYNQYEEGERLPVALYEGAFNKPYYIVE